jgi:hypothetical protein
MMKKKIALKFIICSQIIGRKTGQNGKKNFHLINY